MELVLFGLIGLALVLGAPVIGHLLFEVRK